MNISIEDKTNVDKTITLSATREDLNPRFDKAIKEYRKKITIPGFRPGQVPAGIVKKRFGKEIEKEEIGKYIDDIFKTEILPNHKIVGEPEFEDVTWENDNLQVKIQIAVRPKIELKEISSLEIDKMVHDVTEKEVQEELDRVLGHAASWEESSGPISEKCKVIVDSFPIDEKGELLKEKADLDMELILDDEKNKVIAKSLIGKKAGEEAKVTLGEKEGAETFQLTIKKVWERIVPEFNDDFVKKETADALTSTEDYKSQIKSRIQNYFDQASVDMAKQEIMEKLIEEHPDIELPEAILRNFIQTRMDREMAQMERAGKPDDFDEDAFRDSLRPDAEKEAKWAFIVAELEDKYDDIEISEEDIEAHLSVEAARYGIPKDMVSSFYAQSGEKLEALRQNIRMDKIFERLMDEVKIRELDKEAFQNKKKEKQKDKSDS